MRNRLMMVAGSLIALNLVMSKVAATLSLPVYLDSVGTILAAALLPAWVAALVGVATSLLAAVVVHPAFLYYAGTQLTVAMVMAGAVRLGALQTLPRAGLTGLMIAIVAALVSAPVTVVVFGGVTLGGTTAINAALMAAGQSVWNAVLSGSLLVEAVDKVAACLLACEVLRRLPQRMRDMLRRT